MGGRSTLLLAEEIGDKKIAAIVPICPADNNPGSLSKFKKMGIWFFHNDGDNIVSVRNTEKWCNALENAKVKVNKTIYKAGGHDAWTATYNDEKMWEWLFEQKLNDKKM